MTASEQQNVTGNTPMRTHAHTHPADCLTLNLSVPHSDGTLELPSNPPTFINTLLLSQMIISPTTSDTSLSLLSLRGWLSF